MEVMNWFRGEKKNPTEGKQLSLSAEGSSVGSSTESNPELDALREEAAQTAGEGKEATPRAEPRATAGFPVDDALIGRVWALIFDKVSFSAGSHWKLSSEEETQLGAMTKPVLEKYMPAVMSRYGEELCLAASVAMIVAGKMVKGSANEGIRKEA